MQVELDKQCSTLVLTSSIYFQSAAARADGIIFSTLHKALLVTFKHSILKSLDYKFRYKKAFFSTAILLYFIACKSFSQTPGVVNQVCTIKFSNFLTANNKIDTIATEDKLNFYNYFNIIKCTSGNIYFSGAGFPSTIPIKFKGNTNELRIYFERCISGSKFTLENCSFFRDGGEKSIILNKTVLFE